MSDMIGRLRVALGLETAAFETGAKRATAEINALGGTAEKVALKIGSVGKALALGATALAGGALASQLRSIVDESLRYAQSIGRLSQLAGASAEEFQRAAYAAKSVGIESEKLADIYKDVNDKVGEFLQTGGGEMKDFFDNIAPKVGLTAQQFRDLSGPKALQLYVMALQKAGLNQQEMTFYMEALADEASAMVPLLKDNGSAFNSLAGEIEQAGIMLSADQIQNAGETARKLEQVNSALQVRVAGVVANNTTAIMQLANALGWLAEQAAAGINAWAQVPYMLSGRKFQDFVKDTYGGVQLTFAPEELEWRKAQAARGKQGAGSMQVARTGVWGNASTATGLQRSGSAYTGLGSSRYPAGLFVEPRSAVVPEQAASPFGKSYTPKAKGKGGGKNSGSSGAAKAATREAEQLAEAMRKLSVWGGDASTAIGATNDNLSAFSDRAGPAMDKVLPAFEAAKLKAGEFADKLADLQSRLFPEIDALAKYRGELGLITRALDENKISAEQAAEWRHRLAMEGRSTETAIGEMMSAGETIVDVDKLNEGFEILQDKMKGLRDRSGVLTVEVAKSFKDMADDTISALENMTSVIQGGGFLNIFSAVLKMGLQLGSIGAFGSTIQTNINSVPRRAWGGQVNAGQMYMVGERGPEMFVAGAHGSIVPNHRLAQGRSTGGNTYYLSGNLLTPEFWGQINAGHAMAAQAGGEIGFRKVVTRGRRRLA